MNELHLFAGVGGGILGGMLLGHTCVCAVEIEPYRRQVLLQRQRDGILPKFPIWDDAKTFDGKPWKGFVDVVCGGFPCQDVSVAGKGRGIDGRRSGLWREFRRIIEETEPKAVFIENSPALLSRGFETVIHDLVEMRLYPRWGNFSASQVGLRHKRERIFIYADSMQKRWKRRGEIRQSCGKAWSEHFKRLHEQALRMAVPSGKYSRMADVDAYRVDRLMSIGDAQVPAVAALAYRTLSG